jgi:N-acyl-D-aspartate/D-glutamate deacylase
MEEKPNAIFVAILLTLCSGIVGCHQAATDYDILITNGTILDGSGGPGFSGDIGIVGDTIADLGDLSGRTAVTTIDATGLAVSPGFIDLHTHCDGGLGQVDSNINLNYLIQGTTTVVTGNCGDGTFNIAEIKRNWEELGIGTNAVHLVGFGSVRTEVMGVEPRDANPEESRRIREIIRQAMKDGAWGMSTGLEYVPGRYAATEEIIEVARIVSEYGGVYASHQRNEFDRAPDATRETIRIAEEADVPANVSHLKVCRKNYWGGMGQVVDLIDEARARGINIVADMYPYHFASGGPILPMVRNAGWAPFHLPANMEPFAELRKKMRADDLSDAEMKELRETYIDELAKALRDESKYPISPRKKAEILSMWRQIWSLMNPTFMLRAESCRKRTWNSGSSRIGWPSRATAMLGRSPRSLTRPKKDIPALMAVKPESSASMSEKKTC